MRKNIYFCFIDYAKAFDCIGQNKPWNILQKMGIPNRIICLLRNLHAGQEATVKIGHRTKDWFQTRKGVCQGCMLSPCLFNLHAEYIMWNTRCDEAQAGIKTTGRNTNNLRYADDTILSKEELKSLLMKVKEKSEKADLKLNTPKMKIMASTHRWVNNGNSNRLLFSWAPKSLQMVIAAMKLKDPCSLEEKLWQT